MISTIGRIGLLCVLDGRELSNEVNSARRRLCSPGGFNSGEDPAKDETGMSCLPAEAPDYCTVRP